MYLLEPMSAEPIASLYESADQSLPSSSVSPQCTSRLNFDDGLSVCFQTPRVCCQARRRRNRLLLICHLITDCDKRGEYPRLWFTTASDLLWCAACYEHPYSSPYPQCDRGFVCCQTVLLTFARPSVVESAVRKKDDDRATLYLSVSGPTACLLPDA